MPAAQAMDGPYGPEVGRRWSSGHRLEQAGRYDEALEEYRRAERASAQIRGIDGDPSTVARLRDCAAQGSRLRAEGARAGAEAMAAAASPPAAKDRARAAEAARVAFERASRREDEKRPDLASACP